MKRVFGLIAGGMALACGIGAAEPVFSFDWKKLADGKFTNLSGDGRMSGKIIGDVKTVDGRDDEPALLFNGKKGYVEAPAYGNSKVFSGEAWINIKGKSANKRNIVMIRRGKGNQWQLWLEPEGNQHRLYFFAWNPKAKNSLAVTAKCRNRILSNKWYHVAFELNGADSCKVYINGKVEYEDKPHTEIGRGLSPLRIGGAPNYCFNGLIGPVKVYNSLLPEGLLKKVKQQLLPSYKQPVSAVDAMGFEKNGAWVTAPVELFDIMPESKLWCSKARGSKDWKVTAVTPKQLASGAKLSKDHVTQGKKSLHWKDHTTWPTITCSKVPQDWSKAKSLSFDIYSKAATGEIITIALLSDSTDTKWKDFLVFPIKINWKGEKKITIPLEHFKAYEKPVGLNKIDAVYMFTKIFGCQPHPYTDIYLDNMTLNDTAAGNDWKQYAGQVPALTRQPGFKVERSSIEWQQDQLNHNFPETLNNKAVYAPYTYQNYFRNERDMFKYYPRFIPGYPSFDNNGKAYVNSGDVIQWKDANGKWQTSDIRKTVENWAKKQGWDGLYFSWTHNQSEKGVRFDNDGDAYVLVQAERLNADGKKYDWKTRCTLLLYSTDKMKNWKVYKLPKRTAEFEKIDGSNRECLKNPPVILLGDYKYFKGVDQSGYLLLPEKDGKGGLTFPEPVKYADNCISVCQHSGGGNQALTVNGKIYVVYGWYVEKHARNGDWEKSCPEIPKNHPGLNQSFIRKGHDIKTLHSKDGIPTFIVEYDPKTRKVSKPVFVGFGGGTYDNHNWPAMTVDPKGYLHVIINGHHDPVNYTRSLKPHDISVWTKPEYIMVNTDKPNLSYATLNCDKSGNLYSAHRSTKGCYNNHIGLYRMTPDGKWQEEKTLVTPFKYMYKVWGQKMTYDPSSDRIFLTFYGQSSMKQLMRDQYEFDIFFWPDHEKEYYTNFGKGGLNIGPPKPNGSCNMFVSPASEIATLVSQCPGGKWKLLTSEDMK